MEYIKPTYSIKNIDIKELLFKFDFHKYSKDCLIHRFPVYKYKNKILIYGEFVIYDDDTNTLHVNAFDTNGNSYNINGEEYGVSLVSEIVNKKILTEIYKFAKEGLLLLV